MPFMFCLTVNNGDYCKIKRVEVRHTFPEISEIDVVGFDSKDKPIVMAECKDRAVKKEDLDKWITNSRKLFQDYNCSLEHSYFVTSKKLSNENFERIEKSNDVDSKRGQLKVISGILERGLNFLNNGKGLNESGKVYLSIYEVRQGQFTKVFPRK